MSLSKSTSSHHCQTQRGIKNYCGDNYKTSKALLSTFTQDFKPFDKAKKDKKNKRDFTNPAIKVNVTEVNDKKKRKKDVSEIFYYNCDKKRYYATKCLVS